MDWRESGASLKFYVGMGTNVGWARSVRCSCLGCTWEGAGAGGERGTGKGTYSNRNQLDLAPSRMWPRFRLNHPEMDRHAKYGMF